MISIKLIFILSLFLFTTNVMAEQPKQFNWPELVGKTFEEAEAQVLKDMPHANIVKVPPVYFYFYFYLGNYD